MDRDAVLRDYQAIRAAARQLNNRLTEMLDRKQINEAANALGMRRGNQIELGTEDELCVLMDYAIFETRNDGQTVSERMLESRCYGDDSVEVRILRAMQKARFTVLTVESVVNGFGVQGIDSGKSPIFLVDIGFSSTAVPGSMFATRMISPAEGWWMTTGAALPATPDAMSEFLAESEYFRARTGKSPSPHEEQTMLIRSCILTGASEFIKYAKPGELARPKSRGPRGPDTRKSRRGSRGRKRGK